MLCGSQFAPSGRAGKKAAGKVLSGRLFEHRDASAVRVRPRLGRVVLTGVSKRPGPPFLSSILLAAQKKWTRQPGGTGA